MLQEQKKSTKTLFQATGGTILNGVNFTFFKNSQENFSEKNLRKIFFYKIEKMQCFKNVVSSLWSAFLLSKNEHRVENIFFCKNYNEL